VKKKRFSVEQIVAVLKQIELGLTVAEASRQIGVSEQAIYRWKKVYGGLESDQLRELKQLQDENGRPKRLVADLSLNKVILQASMQENGPARLEAPGGGLHRRPLLDESATGLSDCSTAPQRELPSVRQGTEDGAT
jgi:putative transposase